MTNSSTNHIPYSQTRFFSKLLLDYIANSPTVKPFFEHEVNELNIQQSIKARQAFNTNRNLLVHVLQEQYSGINLHALQQQNIQALLQENTFTITTAHQPNICTGPLYFLYKIAHTIALCNQLNAQHLHAYNFVPVFYMGSEDADLEELNNITIEGKKYTWQTKQTGAVGRMKVDKALLELIDEMALQLNVQPFGDEWIQLLRQSYTLGQSIQQCTLQLVNALFGKYGLIVVIPDTAKLKKAFEPIVKKELIEQFSHVKVKDTIALLQQHYNVQAGGRDINLFYLDEVKRERIILQNNLFAVNNTSLVFTEKEILALVENEPQKISANVILRGVFQEIILPNIAFVGGGGEIAYWLELKKVFEAAQVPYPMLITRNSFLFIQEKQQLLINKLGLQNSQLFLPLIELQNQWVIANTSKTLNLQQAIIAAENLYNQIQEDAFLIDASLVQHTQALKAQTLKKLYALEKKLLRAEKRKHTDSLLQIEKLQQHLFPNNSLQERVENGASLYAKWGESFVELLIEKSLGLQQEFTVVSLS